MSRDRAVDGSADAPLFEDRADAGRWLARLLQDEAGEATLVYGIARGGVRIAAEVASALRAPLDGIAIGQIGHPHHPDLSLGALAAGGPPVFDPRGGWLSPSARGAFEALVANAEADAHELDAALHRRVGPLSPDGAVCVLVGDALGRSAPLIAACRWAHVHRATRTVVAVPVATRDGLRELAGECGSVVCPAIRDDLASLSVWRHDRALISTHALAELIADHRLRSGGTGGQPQA